jgi:hypothetical protein
MENCLQLFVPDAPKNEVNSGHRITLSFSYVTERGEGKMERAGRWGGGQDGKECVWVCTVQRKIFLPLLILTHSVAFSYTNFYTTLYFVNQRNYKTLAIQAHALTRTRYFYSLNVIISYPIVQLRIGLSLRMCYRLAVFPSLPRVYF